MSIGSLPDLAAALEAGIVPADMVNVGFICTFAEMRGGSHHSLVFGIL